MRGKRDWRRWVAGLALAVGIPAAAEAELQHTTAYRTHPVSGTTLGAIFRSMNARPIMDPDDGPAYANLTHAHTLSVKTAVAGGTCRVTDLKFRWNFVLTVPRPTQYGQLSNGERQVWDSFAASLKRHEEGHRTIFLKCGRSFTAAAEKMTAPGSCAGLETKVRRFIDRRYADCMAEQREYEKRDRPRVMSSPFFGAALGK